MSEREILNFNLDSDGNEITPWEAEVTIGPNTYMVVEADGLAAEKYRTAQLSGTTMNQESKDMTVGNLGAVENVLVGNCVYAMDNDGNRKGQRLGPGFVSGWPNRVIEPLFEKIKENSGLNEPETPETVEGLKERIAELLKEKDKLEQKIVNFEEDKLGNSQASTMYG